MRNFFLSSVSVAALVSCSGSSEVYRSYSEAGALVDGGHFGNATMNNTQIMNGEKVYVIDLARRFASDVKTTVNFAFNSSELDAESAAALRQQARWIEKFPEVRFRVYGHTDAVGSQRYNKALGQRRADTVVNYLVQQGINRSRLEAVVSFGETQPLVVAEGRERRNRRTVTEVSGFLQDHPTILHGKYAEVIHREYVESGVAESSLSLVSSGSALSDE